MLRMVAMITVCALLLPQYGVADDAGYLTWVRHYQTKPGGEEMFVPFMKDYAAPTLDRLAAEGKVLSWGIVTPLTRQEQSFNHAMWISFPNWEAMDAVMKAMMADQAARGPEGLKAMREKIAAMVDEQATRDEVYRQVALPAAPTAPSTKPAAYLRVAWYKLRPEGNERNAVALYNQVAAPVYGELMKSGAVLAAGLAKREFTPDSNATHISWAMLSDMGALDKINAGLANMDKQRTEKSQPDLASSLNTLFDMEAYRSQLFRVVHYGGSLTPAAGKPQQ